MNKRAFGDLELAVLHILKKKGGRSVKDVLQELGEEHKYTTIMTVMNRLCEKGKLVREKESHHFIYWFVEQKTETFGDQIKKKLFGVKPAELINYLIETSDDISKEDLQKIEDLIHQAKGKKQ